GGRNRPIGPRGGIAIPHRPRQIFVHHAQRSRGLARVARAHTGPVDGLPPVAPRPSRVPPARPGGAARGVRRACPRRPERSAGGDRAPGRGGRSRAHRDALGPILGWVIAAALPAPVPPAPPTPP